MNKYKQSRELALVDYRKLPLNEQTRLKDECANDCGDNPNHYWSERMQQSFLSLADLRAAAGSLGGKKKTKAKKQAARTNGKKSGGRPKKTQPNRIRALPAAAMN